MLNRLLRHAQSRLLGQRLLAALTLALTVFMGALIPLLVAGTAIWDWRAPVILGGAALLAALIRLYFSRPSRTEVALLLDERFHLADALSTALHFGGSDVEMAQAQRQDAERAAAAIDCAEALPFSTPRAIYALAVLTVAAAALFLFRWRTESQLSLRAPLAHIPFLSPDNRPAPIRKQPDGKAPNPQDSIARLGTSTSDNPEEKDSAGAPGTAVTSEAAKRGAGESAAASSADGKQTSGTEQESTAVRDNAAQSKPESESPPSSRDGSPQNAQAAAKNSSGAANSGMMSKLRDAVSGLLSKMKRDENAPASQTASASQQSRADQPPGRSGSPKPGQSDAKGSSSEQGGDESSSDAEQMAPGKGAGNASESNASAKPGSGMGHGDGSKELKDSQDLQAMGKLSEIIGKRSAAVTGEMTVEPQSGPQQLKTGYTRSSARHGEATGDVNRDEVPLDMQPYVQQYFDRVHKDAAAQASRAKKASPS